MTGLTGSKGGKTPAKKSTRGGNENMTVRSKSAISRDSGGNQELNDSFDGGRQNLQIN